MTPAERLISRPLQGVLLVLALAFISLVALRVHGFSLPIWHSVIDRSPAPEVLLGEPRYLRADDWLVQLPLALAQRAHEPAFPVVNTDIGLGQTSLLPVVLPVLHPAILFRPTQWGYFIGGDVGLAWMWWLQVLGMAGVWLLVMMVVTRGHLAVSAAATALLLASPFFQFWAFTKSSTSIYMGLCFLASVSLLTAKRRPAIVASGLLLGWAGGAFALVLYPAFQVPLAYLYLALLAGWLWDQRARLDLRTEGRARVVAALLALVIAGAAVTVLIRDGADAIALIEGTSYPGNRISTGGDAPSWHLFTAHLAVSLQASDFRPLINIVEASSFLLLLPIVLAAMLWRRERDPLALVLVLYCAAMLLYRELGLPELLARASLLSYVPAKRTIVGLGLADALLLARYLSSPAAPSASADAASEAPAAAPRDDRVFALAVALVWALVVSLAARVLYTEVPGLSRGAVFALVLAQAALAWFVIRRSRPVALLATLAVALALTGVWFNPLVRGGTEFLLGNPLSRQIQEIDRGHGGKSLWLIYGSSDLANLPRMLGVHAIPGNQGLPQLALWEQLDPSDAAREVYNRYAHVGFVPPTGEDHPPRFRLRSHQGFIVELDPQGEPMAALGVTHLLVRLRRSSAAYWERFEPVYADAQNRIYALPLVERATAP